MEQQMTFLCDIDPMMDDVKVLARCISIWKSHAAGKPNQPWGLDVVLQDLEGNRIQASIKLENMNKFLAVLDEGSCYRIGDFGVGKNGRKFPLLNHRYKINFYQNTSVTRVIHFDQNLCGFKFEPFQNFTTKRFGSTDTVGIPEIVAFKQRYLENDGEYEKNHAISLYTPLKKEVTIEEFFNSAIKKMVGSIRESGYEYEAIVYAKVHKIHRENGWTYTGCKRCGSKAKLIDSSESKPKTAAQSSSMTSGESSSFAAWHNTPKPKAPKQLWWCKRHELIEAVGPNKMVGVPCYKLKEQYGANAENTFPEELTYNIVGKQLLFHFTYSEYNISNNNHVYQVKMMSENPEFIKHFKKDFIIEDEDDVL
ncbi:replication protein A 70 kDa DNA-binding subunit B, partial [Tanacetum coccineum]